MLLVYGMGCSFTGWSVRLQDGMLVYRMGCWYTEWGVGVLIYGMGC